LDDYNNDHHNSISAINVSIWENIYIYLEYN
jgi:hypothetical protein